MQSKVSLRAPVREHREEASQSARGRGKGHWERPVCALAPLRCQGEHRRRFMVRQGYGPLWHLRPWHRGLEHWLREGPHWPRGVFIGAAYRRKHRSEWTKTALVDIGLTVKGLVAK